MIDIGILVNLSETNMKDLVTFLKETDFKSIRKWVANNLDNDPSRMYRKVYDTLYDEVQPQTVPHLVLATADYSYKSNPLLQIKKLICCIYGGNYATG